MSAHVCGRCHSLWLLDCCTELLLVRVRHGQDAAGAQRCRGGAQIHTLPASWTKTRVRIVSVVLKVFVGVVAVVREATSSLATVEEGHHTLDVHFSTLERNYTVDHTSALRWRFSIGSTMAAHSSRSPRKEGNEEHWTYSKSCFQSVFQSIAACVFSAIVDIIDLQFFQRQSAGDACKCEAE